MADIITKESPFSPGRPVQPEYFVARIKEIQRLERAIKQTVSGRNENVFITGQRGIGKSSLAMFIRYLAEKEYNLIGTHCYLGGVRSLEDMMGAIFHRLLQDCTDKSLFDKLRDIFGSYIKGLTLFGVGVEFTKDKADLQMLVDNFLAVLQKIYEEVKENGKKGLILILDDLNGISDVPQFSQFLKSRVDELATSGKPLPILIILAGLPERRDELVKHQPSVARIFDVVNLPPMSNSESEDFFMNMFGEQNVTVTSEALSLMVGLSGGLPMLMHEVGDAVFWQDTDSHISETDAKQGVMEAARIVGTKYIDTKISKVLRSETYSSILWQMGKKLPLGATFRRQELLKVVGEKEKKNLDNFLNRIKKLGLVDDTEVRGEYTFVNPLYHLYIW
ncbi:AAA family ATPase, partial [archaeon]|nr:AAA family ATPase [archaeon]